MTLDHMGKVLFPEILWLQIVGRLAFPLFLYCAVIGAVHTHSVGAYLLRLLICGAVSQPFYVLALHRVWWQLNTIFDLLFCVAAITAIRQKKWALFLVACAGSAFSSYGLYGMALALSLYWFVSGGGWLICAAALVLPAFTWPPDCAALGVPFSMQGAALFALPLLLVPAERKKTLPKALFYVWYPLHLGILSVLA